LHTTRHPTKRKTTGANEGADAGQQETEGLYPFDERDYHRWVVVVPLARSIGGASSRRQKKDETQTHQRIATAPSHPKQTNKQ